VDLPHRGKVPNLICSLLNIVFNSEQSLPDGLISTVYTRWLIATGGAHYVFAPLMMVFDRQQEYTR
jgi:hypothetical protein